MSIFLLHTQIFFIFLIWKKLLFFLIFFAFYFSYELNWKCVLGLKFYLFLTLKQPSQQNSYKQAQHCLKNYSNSLLLQLVWTFPKKKTNNWVVDTHVCVHVHCPFPAPSLLTPPPLSPSPLIPRIPQVHVSILKNCGGKLR